MKFGVLLYKESMKDERGKLKVTVKNFRLFTFIFRLLNACGLKFICIHLLFQSVLIERQWVVYL